jgi:hypothetical protein
MVVGAGAMGLAFVDALLTLQPNATVVLVDRHSSPGGHWNDDYDYVQLHQPSLVYGVNSRQLEGHWLGTLVRKRTLPWMHRATKPEILQYYRDVVDHHAASGRLRYFPNCSYEFARRQHRPQKKGQHKQDHYFSTYLVGGSTTAGGDSTTTTTMVHYRVSVKEILVDAVQGEVKIPATTPPNFDIEQPPQQHPQEGGGVAGRIRVVTPNELHRSSTNHTPGLQEEQRSRYYVVLGCGKTGMDTIVYLIRDLKVPQQNVMWVVSRDVWMFNRNRAGPSRYHQALLHQDGDRERAMDELESRRLVFRLDPDVRPAAPFRFPTVSPSELNLLRHVQNKVRRGRIQSISTVVAAAATGEDDSSTQEEGSGSGKARTRYYPRLLFQDGTDLVLTGWDVDQTVFVRCTSPGPFNDRKLNNFYNAGRQDGHCKMLTLFPLFPPPVPQSGAALAYVETARRQNLLDLEFARELVSIQQQQDDGVCDKSNTNPSSMDGLDVLGQLLRPYYVGSEDSVAQLEVHRNLAVILAVADKNPTVVADWLSRGNRLSEYNWISKLRVVENMRLMIEKAHAIGYADKDVAAFRRLADKLESLEGR